ncbi:MAG: MATE family efflux transporter [Tissierellia bacterium]|nr:MATE family efflux transporter [Tissierellia bacterium]
MQENKMGTWPVGRLLLSISLPIALSMLIQALYNIVDSIFVSMINETAFTAVSIAFPFQHLINAIAIGSGVGMNSLLSRSLGEKKFDKASRVGQTGFFLVLVQSLIFLILGYFLSPVFFAFQTDDPQILTYGVRYLRIVTMVSIGLLSQIYTERLLQSTGRAFYSMACQMTGAVLNMVLDPILIFGLGPFPAMGITGAAVATVFSQIVGSLLGLYFNLTKNKELDILKKGFRPQWDIIRGIFQVGVPTSIMLIANSVAIFLMNIILVTFSSTAVAAYGIFFKLNSIIFMPVFGMNNGLVPIIAYNYGARNKDRIHATIKLAMKLAFAFMLLGCLVVQLFPQELLSLFSPSDALRAIGQPMLRIIALSFPVAAISIVSSAVFQALGHGNLSLTSALIRQMVVLVPVAYFLSLKGQVQLIWWSHVVAEGVAIILSLYFLKKVDQKEIQPLC